MPSVFKGFRFFASLFDPDHMTYGPFKAKWHKNHVDEEFIQNFRSFLKEYIYPDVTINFKRNYGSLTASYNDKKYCGQNSAIKDIYKFEYVFQNETEQEEIDIELKYDRDKGIFASRYPGVKLRLFTVDLQDKSKKLHKLISEAMEKNELKTLVCPFCHLETNIERTEALFSVHCDNDCFESHFHICPESGETKHGHIFIR